VLRTATEDSDVRAEAAVAAATAPEPAAVPVTSTGPQASSTEAPQTAAAEEDLLGLGAIFQEEPLTQPARPMSDEEMDRIADRVIQKLSTQVIESIAWDIVPDITHKVLREELKRIDES